MHAEADGNLSAESPILLCRGREIFQEGEESTMAIQRFGNETRAATRASDAHRWQRGNSNNRYDDGRVRETRAESVKPE